MLSSVYSSLFYDGQSSPSKNIVEIVFTNVFLLQAKVFIHKLSYSRNLHQQLLTLAGTMNMGVHL